MFKFSPYFGGIFSCILFIKRVGGAWFSVLLVENLLCGELHVLHLVDFTQWCVYLHHVQMSRYYHFFNFIGDVLA